MNLLSSDRVAVVVNLPLLVRVRRFGHHLLVVCIVRGRHQLAAGAVIGAPLLMDLLRNYVRLAAREIWNLPTSMPLMYLFRILHKWISRVLAVLLV